MVVEQVLTIVNEHLNDSWSSDGLSIYLHNFRIKFDALKSNFIWIKLETPRKLGKNFLLKKNLASLKTFL